MLPQSAPRDRNGYTFFWCERCGKLYWNGSHGKSLLQRIDARAQILIGPRSLPLLFVRNGNSSGLSGILSRRIRL